MWILFAVYFFAIYLLLAIILCQLFLFIALTKLSQAEQYFQALKLAVDSNDTVLQAVSFSCVCHLVKRIITQDPQFLKHPAQLVLPMVIDKLGHAKPSIRATARRVYEDYWMACIKEAEECLRSVGFHHPDHNVRAECLQMVTTRLQLLDNKFAFRQFTGPVVKLLSDQSDTVRLASHALLVQFFKTASIKAKQDLFRELVSQSTEYSIASAILRDIDLKLTYPKNSTVSTDNRKDNAAIISNKQPHIFSKTSAISDSRQVTELQQQNYKYQQPAIVRSETRQHTRVVSDHRPSSQSLDSSDSSSPFSTLFITSLPGYRLDPLQTQDIESQYFKREVEFMTACFEGKETEFNWSDREKVIVKLRQFTRGSLGQECPECIIWSFKLLADGIVKAISSLRTTLSANGCALIKEVAIVTGSMLDPIVEPFLTCLIKLTSGVKKLTAQAAAMVVNIMIMNTSYSLKYLNHIWGLMNDKMAQPKVFATTWLRLLMAVHHGRKHLIDSSGGRLLIENSLKKSLTDSNPSVREGSRTAFWVYYHLWPDFASAVMDSLDSSTRKALERSKLPNSSKSTANTSDRGPVKVTRAPARQPIRITPSFGRDSYSSKRVSETCSNSSSFQQQNNDSVKLFRQDDISDEKFTTQVGSLRKPRSVTPNGDSIPSTNLDVHGQIMFNTTDKPATDGSKVSRNVKVFYNSNISNTTDDSATNGSKISESTQLLYNSSAADTTVPLSNDKELTSGTVGLSATSDNIISKNSITLPDVSDFTVSQDDNNERDPCAISSPPTASSTLREILQSNDEKIFLGGMRAFLTIQRDDDDDDDLPLSLFETSLLRFKDIALSRPQEIVDLVADFSKSIVTMSKDIFSEGDLVDIIIPHVLRDECWLVDCLGTFEGISVVTLLAKSLGRYRRKPYFDEAVVNEIITIMMNHKNDNQDQDISQRALIELSDMLVGFPILQEKLGSLIQEIKSLKRMDHDFPVKKTEESEEANNSCKESIDSTQVQEVFNSNNETDETLQQVSHNTSSVNSSQESRIDDIVNSSQQNRADSIDQDVDWVVNDGALLNDSENTGEVVDESDSVNEAYPSEDDMDTKSEYKSVPFDSELDNINIESRNLDVQKENIEPVNGSKMSIQLGSDDYVNGSNENFDDSSPQSQPLQSSPLSLNSDGCQDRSITSPIVSSLSSLPTNIMADQFQSKLQIYEDPLDEVRTPAKLKPSWLTLESRNKCLSPLPQQEKEATELFDLLFKQLSDKTIDSHGMKKLISVVQGIHSGYDGAAFDIWKIEKRLQQLRQGLISYLLKDLDETETNQGLFGLSQLMTLEPLVFRDCDEELTECLIKVSNVTSSRIVGLSAIAETRDIILQQCDKIIVMDTLLESLKEPSTEISMSRQTTVNFSKQSRELKVLVLSSLAKMVSEGLVGKSDITTRLPLIASIVFNSISESETYVRMEVYPLLVALKRVYANDPLLDSVIVGRLSSGQQHLLEYYCSNAD